MIHSIFLISYEGHIHNTDLVLTISPIPQVTEQGDQADQLVTPHLTLVSSEAGGAVLTGVNLDLSFFLLLLTLCLM